MTVRFILVEDGENLLRSMFFTPSRYDDNVSLLVDRLRQPFVGIYNFRGTLRGTICLSTAFLIYHLFEAMLQRNT